MAVETKPTLKTYFETGDIPTQAQFGNLIDSLAHISDIESQVLAANVVVQFDKDYIYERIVQTGAINLTGDFTNALIGSVARVEIQGNGSDPITHGFTTGLALGSFDNTTTNVVYIRFISNNTVDLLIDQGSSTNPQQPQNPANFASLDMGFDMADAVTTGNLIDSVPNKFGGGSPLVATGVDRPVLGTQNSQPIAQFDGTKHWDSGFVRASGSNYETWLCVANIVHIGANQFLITHDASGGGKFRINASDNVFSYAATSGGSPSFASVEGAITEGLHMIAIVSDTDGKHKLYIDGNLVVQSTPTLADFGSAQDVNWSRFWHEPTECDLAEFYHYNDALTASQINQAWLFIQSKYSL